MNFYIFNVLYWISLVYGIDYIELNLKYVNDCNSNDYLIKKLTYNWYFFLTFYIGSIVQQISNYA